MQTPLERLIELFGSHSDLARAISVHHSLITKWNQRLSGKIPSRYNDRILAAAKERHISHKAVATCLTHHLCPLCGNRLKSGQGIDKNAARRLAEMDQ